MAIRIFVTGGTFDKEYDEIAGRLFFKETHVPEMLRLGRSRVDVALTTLMMIDSLDMTDADRARIVEGCRTCAEARIVITHGTDTMVETACLRAAAVAEKTIVLTGAMVRTRLAAPMGSSTWEAPCRLRRCCRQASTSR
jgi:L-asparaginase